MKPAILSWPKARPKEPPALDSFIPPVSGLLHPTLVLLAFEKLLPANGPAENINGLSGPSGSALAAPVATNCSAIK